MDIMEMLKDKIDDIVDKIKTDKDIAAKFQKDPIGTVEKLLGINLPEDQIEALIKMVKAKVDLDALSGGLSKLGGLFK